MRKHPKFIQLKDKSWLPIDSYSTGKFWIATSPLMIYDIETGKFYQILDGKEQPASTEPRDPDAHRAWLKREENRRKILANLRRSKDATRHPLPPVL